MRGRLSWSEALEEFLLLRQAQGLAPRTLQDYRIHVGRFFRYYDCWPDVSRAALEYMAKPCSPGYYNIKLKYLRVFFAWCRERGLIPENPLERFHARKAEGRAVQLESDVLRRLLELPDRRTYTGLRDYALLCLTLDTGIRPGEALSLLPGDVDLRAREVRVRAQEAKTRSSRTLPISPPTAEALARLISARHPAWKGPLFCGQDGMPMTIFGWRYRLKVYSSKLGVRITPYDLRHAFALEYLRNGGNAMSLQRLLGHTTMEMTKRYVSLTQEDIRTMHAAASPLAALVRHRVRLVEGVRRPRS